MIVFEFKVKAKPTQYAAIDEAIQTSQFVQNKCLRYWMDNEGASKYDLNKYCSVLAKEFSFASKLNSQARQASAERAWTAISRFYENCRKVETCHDRVKKSLSQRTHVCGNRGYVEDRDIAASLNILQKGLSTVGHTGTYAWGDLPSWAVGAILSSNGKSKNQESPLL
ncbi:hypothetical protein [Coleofasciculus sp. E2-BRE-01]|uniref:hypothetical protein n=1 Tax=Coleofasciculus sp. E2-BRE-01 TaxID=3069524 RepID=UPI0032FF7682